MDVRMGDKVKDEVSGLTGTVTARVVYMTGCVQFLVTPKWVEGNTYHEGHWIDEMRLKQVPKRKPATKKKKVKYHRMTSGAGPSAPTRSGGPVGTTA